MMSSGQAIFTLLCDKHQTVGPAGEEKTVPCWFCENEKLRAELAAKSEEAERLREGLLSIADGHAYECPHREEASALLAGTESEEE